MRREFQMTQEEMDKIIAINREGSDPLIYISGGQHLGQSLREKINDYWIILSEKYGFDRMTAGPSTKGGLYFTAEPK